MTNSITADEQNEPLFLLSEEDDGHGTGVQCQCNHDGLLNRILLLEQQVAACLNTQPLLYQLGTKSTQLEESVQVLKAEVDRTLQEIANVLPAYQVEVAEVLNPDQDPLSPQGTSEDEDLQNYEFVLSSEQAVPCPGVQQFQHHQTSVPTWQAMSDVKPFQCKLCQLSHKMIFEDSEALANHYSYEHGLDMPPDDSDGVKNGDSQMVLGAGSGERQSISVSVEHKNAATIRHNQKIPGKQSMGLSKARQVKVKRRPRPPRRRPASSTGQECICPICSRPFARRQKMMRHLLEIHSDPKFKCEDCGKVFRRKDNFRSHWMRIHGKRDDDMPDPIRYTYTTKWNHNQQRPEGYDRNE